MEYQMDSQPTQKESALSNYPCRWDELSDIFHNETVFVTDKNHGSRSHIIVALWTHDLWVHTWLTKYVYRGFPNSRVTK